MPLPASFTFSQASLQDYTDCPRRFQLRYVLGVRWPVAHEDSIVQWERKAQLGAAFHRMVQQHMVGIPEEAIAATMPPTRDTKDLHQWWKHYLQTPPEMPPTSASGALRRSEVRLTTPLAGHHLMARYDLLAIEPGKRAVIVDWKTNERRPLRAHLEARWQTRVYRYVLVRAGAQINGSAQCKPDQVELIYWFANYPAQPERFPYDDAQFTEDEWALKTIISEVAARNEIEWTLTDDLKQCRYCAYHTLCDREKVDAKEPEWEPGDEEIPDLDIDLEQVAEIEF